MPRLFTRRGQETVMIAPQSPTLSTNRTVHTPDQFGRRIHRDLNSLAEELTAASAHGEVLEGSQTHQAVPQVLTYTDQSDATDFIGLEPSTRRRSRLVEHLEDKRSLKFDPPLHADEIAKSSKSEAYRDNEEDKDHAIQKAQVIETTSSDIFSPFPSAARLALNSAVFDQSVAMTMESNALTRWPTFGSHNSHFTRISGSAERGAPRSQSQSSLSPPRSRNTSLSYYISEDAQPRTPKSQSHSLLTSTPYTRRVPSDKRDPMPSPHTFGVPTPPGSEPRHDQSYFNFTEIPPPLPPLDHPAFRESIDEFGVSSKRQPHSISRVDGGVATRHSHSLPSLTRPTLTTATASEGINNKTQRYARERSKSSSGTATTRSRVKAKHETPKKIFHSSNLSKSSIASSRRSSAEYSAKQASSIGHDGCWEVDVTKAMITLSLGEGQGVETRTSTNFSTSSSMKDARTGAASGKARGNNRAPGEVAVGLGSPFFLQDPLSHNLRDKQLSNDQHARLEYQHRTRASKKVVIEEPLRVEVMSHGETIIPSSANAAASSSRSEEAASSPTDPSRAPLPSAAKIETGTAPLGGSFRGTTSLLAPPLLSVTAPTPGSSPISPIRRTHYKSTPTMPTKSVLRTPSTPPIIEKSHSSSSGKRKAEEAGVGGDKTPPKEQRSTSFAPEPRTHRASATSTSNSSGHAPSSFNKSKRVRLTESSEGGRSTRSGTLPTAEESAPNAKTTGSWSSKGSHGPKSASSHTHTFRENSYRDGPSLARSASHASHGSRAPSRRSLSQASIPLSALVSPHAPSVGRSGTFHMRDPRKPPPVQNTPWTLSFPSHIQEGESRWDFGSWVERGGSPLHGWLFFIGFVIFPLWWAAALCIPIPRTRRLGGTDAEKGVILDDPQVEHDAKSWRTRCRIMAGVSFITYIPFIALVAIYA